MGWKQWAILIGNAIVIMLLSSGNRRTRRVGHTLGVVVQPLWLWETYAAQQWGMFMLSVWYVGMYARGMHSNRPHRSQWTPPPNQGCKLPPRGWYCSLEPGHLGPCAARSTDPNHWSNVEERKSMLDVPKFLATPQIINREI